MSFALITVNNMNGDAMSGNVMSDSAMGGNAISGSLKHGFVKNLVWGCRGLKWLYRPPV